MVLQCFPNIPQLSVDFVAPQELVLKPAVLESISQKKSAVNSCFGIAIANIANQR